MKNIDINTRYSEISITFVRENKIIMKREIKFRAWDGKRKFYKYPKLWDNTMPSNWESHYILEQFTGIKDKNDVDIYEGKESVKLIIIGVGEGLADIVMHEGKWCVYETSQGYAPLFELLNSSSIKIESNNK